MDSERLIDLAVHEDLVPKEGDARARWTHALDSVHLPGENLHEGYDKPGRAFDAPKAEYLGDRRRCSPAVPAAQDCSRAV